MDGRNLLRSLAAAAMFTKTFCAILLTASAAMAATLPRALPSGTVTCGSNKYSVSAIEAAIDAGVKDMDDDYYPGRLTLAFTAASYAYSSTDDYPHQYYEYV